MYETHFSVLPFSVSFVSRFSPSESSRESRKEIGIVTQSCKKKDAPGAPDTPDSTHEERRHCRWVLLVQLKKIIAGSMMVINVL